MAEITVLNNNTILVENADDLLKDKSMEQVMEHVRDIVNGPTVEPWSATQEQRKTMIEKMRDLHAFCKEAHIPMAFVAQVAYEDDSPIYDYCRVGASDRSEERMDIAAAVCMLLFGGEGKVKEFDAIELKNFYLRIEELLKSHMIKQ